MASKIVRSGKDGVTWLASGRIDTGTLMRTSVLSANAEMTAHGGSVTMRFAAVLRHL